MTDSRVPNCCKYKADGTVKESQQKFQNLSKKTILHPFPIAGTCDFAGAQVPHVTCDWRLKLLRLIES